MSKYSENEDDPYESSGDEWKEEEEVKKNSRRSSQRLSKKPRMTVVEYGSSDDSDSEPARKKSKNGVTKKAKVQEEDEDDDDYSAEEDEDEEIKEETEKVKNSGTKATSGTTGSPVPAVRQMGNRKFIPKTLYSEDYTTGSFVILKKDAEGDASKHPCIWRIDGKALLQKYEAYDEDGKVRHKNTSIYTGWSPMDKDLYAPVTVDVIQHNNQNLRVELHWDKLKDINADSD
ncbi:uncharacterized protein LOC114329078 [Diabrotica virgifera virgifera]|uniref:Uncharacterized protein LOC114329078 n=1 Tax=Diabrotica virgifera virgifera TaxID=50390 RepID=A0A6P7FG55_DIAVI|nr:uncharacterized protein LOC114329078 [Diabrotica virgifera virgifera]